MRARASLFLGLLAGSAGVAAHRVALEGALELHGQWPANKAGLADALNRA